MFRARRNNTRRTKSLSNTLRVALSITLGLIVGLLNEPVVMAQEMQFNLDNEIVWYDDRCIPDGGGTGAVRLAGSDNIEKILNFFMQKGLTLAQAAGFVGNMQQESGLRPDIEQGGRIVDENYTPINGVGFGLIQWTWTARQAPLVALADEMGMPITSIEVQLEYVWQELNADYQHTLEALRATNDPVEAAVAVHGPPWPGYEASADSPAFVREVRGGYAKEVYDKYKDAPPIGGASMPDGETVTQGSTAFNERMPTIAIDPGHSSQRIEDIDEETGVLMADYTNGQEDKDVFDVSLRVKTMLEEEGYNVVMLKDTIDERVNYRERIGRAEHAGAVMGISIHTSPNANEVYNQFVGGHRYDPSNPSNRHEFSNSGTATLSTQYSEAMAEGRSEIEGTNVVVKKNNFNGRAGIWGGDLPVISLLSDEVPWVYNEFGGPNSGGGNGISEEEIQLYAEGIVNGVKKSGIEATPGGVDSCGNAKGTGAGAGFEATLLGYAWPDPISNGDTNATDTYKTEVIGKARENGRYIGGISHPGIDCGGFVTSLLIDSGFETNYNYGGEASGGAGSTETQEKWLAENWEKLPSGIPDAADLPQGAVAMQPGHTFVFVGDVDGFNSDVASASLDSRAPAAGGNSITESANWYVKK